MLRMSVTDLIAGVFGGCALALAFLFGWKDVLQNEDKAEWYSYAGIVGPLLFLLASLYSNGEVPW